MIERPDQLMIFFAAKNMFDSRTYITLLELLHSKNADFAPENHKSDFLWTESQKIFSLSESSNTKLRVLEGGQSIGFVSEDKWFSYYRVCNYREYFDRQAGECKQCFSIETPQDHFPTTFQDPRCLACDDLSRIKYSDVDEAKLDFLCKNRPKLQEAKS